VYLTWPPRCFSNRKVKQRYALVPLVISMVLQYYKVDCTNVVNKWIAPKFGYSVRYSTYSTKQYVDFIR